MPHPHPPERREAQREDNREAGMGLAHSSPRRSMGCGNSSMHITQIALPGWKCAVPESGPNLQGRWATSGCRLRVDSLTMALVGSSSTTTNTTYYSASSAENGTMCSFGCLDKYKIWVLRPARRCCLHCTSRYQTVFHHANGTDHWWEHFDVHTIARRLKSVSVVQLLGVG